jgi:RNA polymerase sigma-70 factor (ECF subfamily)
LLAGAARTCRTGLRPTTRAPGATDRPALALALRLSRPTVPVARGRSRPDARCVAGSTGPVRLSIGDRACLLPSTDFERTYSRFLPPVRAKCFRLLGRSHAAEDVAQEAFLRLWKSGQADGDPRSVMAWLYRTATRLAIDVLRDRRRIDAREGVEETMPCGVDLRAYVEARAAIAALAASVPEDELAAAVLCRVDGLPQPEAATVLGVSERTVRRMLDRFDERTRPLRKELST